MRCAWALVVAVSAALLSDAARAAPADLLAERDAAVADALAATDPLLAAGAAARALALFSHDDDPAARRAFAAKLRSQAKSPFARAIGEREGAAASLRKGDLDDARAQLRALGHPDSVSCIGPFANTGGTGFGSPTPADDVIGTAGRAVEGLDRPVQWRTVPHGGGAGFDVGSGFVARREVRALCTAVVSAGAAGFAALRYGSAGQLRLVVNGVEVARDDVDRPLDADQGAALVRLEKGANVVVFEVGTLGRNLAFDVRLTAPDGGPLRAPKASWSALPTALPATLPTSTTSASTSKPPLLAATPAATATGPALAASVALWMHNDAYDHRARPTELERALQALAQAASTSTSKASALSRLASVRVGRDRTEARALLEAALALDPQSAPAWSALGALLAEVGDGAEASKAHARAVELWPTSPVLRAARFEHERRRGVMGVVIEREIVTAASTSKSPQLLRLAAEVFADRDDHVRELELLARAKDVDFGAWAQARIELLTMQLTRDDAPAVRAELLSLLAARLAASPAAHGLAQRRWQYLVDAGDAAGARALLDARLARYPDRPEPYALAARAALAAGRRDEARTLLGEALARAPEDGDLQRDLQALAEGKSSEDALARHLPAFDPAAARASVPARTELAGSYVHSRAVATRFFENGQLRQIEDTVVVVTDAKRAQGLRAFHFGYSGGREDVDVLVAERVTRAGRREPATRIVDRGQDGKESGAYSDARTKSAIFAAVDDGDVFHLRVRKEARGLQNLFGDFFGDLEVISGARPVQRFRYVVEAPLSRPLYWGGRGAPTPVVHDDGDVRVYEFARADVAALEGEPSMPPYLEIADYLSISTYEKWAELGVWYEALIGEQLRLDATLQRVAAELKAGAKNDEEIVRRTYEHVVRETRYVGIELGIHGWKPYPVSEVYRRRFGDCKDKASLLVALLRAQGVPAHIALVRTIQLGHAAEAPPSMWSFNHAIAYVPGLDRFLDGTAEQSGADELPTMDQGALSLIVDGANSRLVTIPVQAAERNLNVSDYVLRLQEDGSVVVSGTERFRGHHNANERRQFADPATRKETLERQLAQGIPGAQVKSVEVSPLGLEHEEIWYRFEAVLPQRASVAADGSLTLPLSLYPHDLSGSYAEQSTRKRSLFFDHPWRTRNVMRYVLPPGFRVAELPAGGSVDGPHVKFTQKVTATADGFIVDEDTALVARRVDVDAYARFRRDALSADALMKRTLRLQRAAAPSPDSATKKGGR